MPIQNAPDNQKVDYLWKKIAYGATKTDIAGNIDATQEPFPSPLQIRADKILQNSDQIPAVIPGSNTSVVTVYTTSLPVECTSASGIPTPTLTWLTGQTFWIPPEFGSTYQVKVYISPSGQAGNVLTKGTQVFATGSGNNDLWVFDYQSGILNFNSNNTPYNASNQPISFTGNSVYISGAVYSGAFGLQTPGNIANVILGNITFSGNTISSNQANGNIVLDPPGTGTVVFAGNSAVGLPSGDDSTRPTYPEIGYTRYNTTRQSIEYYDGNSWLAPGAATISSEVINPDGAANTYTLGSNTTVDSVLVSINGTLQQPIYSYNIVNNNQITFTETPLTSDIIEVRFIAVSATSVSSLRYGPVTAVTLDLANVNVTGNILPSANVTYSLGSADYQWKDLWVSGNSIYIGGSALTVANGQLSIGGNTVGSAITYSNINVKAYTESMGFANYSNVNVAAYTQTQSYTNYSNVNLSAYLGGAVTIGGNLTVNGNLFVNGNLTTINANNLNINDSLIFMADFNPADTLDIGVVSSFTDAVRYQHTGFVRDATDGTWKIFANVVPEPTTTVDFTNATYSNLRLGNLTAIGAVFTGNVVAANLNLNSGLATARMSMITSSGTGNFTYNTSLGYSWFESGNDSASPAMRLQTGSLGIGTSNPGYRFHVVNATGGLTSAFQSQVGQDVMIRLDNQSIHYAFWGSDNRTGSAFYANSSANASVFGTTTTNNIQFVTNWTERVRILGTTGNVGINTANPTTTLDVNGSATFRGNITGNVAGFAIGYRDLPQIIASNVTLALSDASEHFYANTGAPTTITVPSNANVAFPIGTTIVIVNRGVGNITIQNQAAGAPFLYLAGNAITTTSRTLTQYGMATLLKTETNLWFVNGTGLI